MKLELDRKLRKQQELGCSFCSFSGPEHHSSLASSLHCGVLAVPVTGRLFLRGKDAGHRFLKAPSHRRRKASSSLATQEYSLYLPAGSLPKDRPYPTPATGQHRSFCGWEYFAEATDVSSTRDDDPSPRCRRRIKRMTCCTDASPSTRRASGSQGWQILNCRPRKLAGR